MSSEAAASDALESDGAAASDAAAATDDAPPAAAVFCRLWELYEEEQAREIGKHTENDEGDEADACDAAADDADDLNEPDDDDADADAEDGAEADEEDARDGKRGARPRSPRPRPLSLWSARVRVYSPRGGAFALFPKLKRVGLPAAEREGAVELPPKEAESEPLPPRWRGRGLREKEAYASPRRRMCEGDTKKTSERSNQRRKQGHIDEAVAS